eukprot:11201652-Alexandrium_andersonii.AAC.1
MSACPRRRLRMVSDFARGHHDARGGNSAQGDTSPWVALELMGEFMGDEGSAGFDVVAELDSDAVFRINVFQPEQSQALGAQLLYAQQRGPLTT